MTQTFGWVPTHDAAGDTSYRTLSAQFGDGYRQQTADGINNAVQSWTLTFIDQASTIQAILAFLDAHAGHKAFLWTPPGRSQGYYCCAAVKSSFLEGAVSAGDDLRQLDATFEQVFRP